MHISEGVLSAPVLIAGAAVAAGGIALGLKKLREDRLMTAGLVGAAFFVASLIHVPVGISSAHLILNGLVGILLGWGAVPVIFTALLLQGLLLQFGGLTVLGVNTVTMGAGAIAAFYLFRAIDDGRAGGRFLAAAAAAGASAILVSSLLTAAALVFTEEGFWAAAAALLLTHLPIMIAEGIITALACKFIARVAPELLKESSL